jgi:site-specific recombinase XerD
MFEYELDSFDKSLAELGKSKATRESYLRDCRGFFQFMSNESVSEGDVSPKILQQYSDYLINRGLSINSVRRSTIGVRQFYRYRSESIGQKFSPLDESTLLKRVELPSSRVTDDVWQRILNSITVDDSLKSYRDRVLFCLLGLEGLKVNELISLKWVQYSYLGESKEGLLKVGGARSRTLRVDPVTSQALADYRSRMPKAWGNGSMPLLLGLRGHESSHSSLTRHGIKFVLYEIGKAADVSHLNSEELRHHAVRWLLNDRGMSHEQSLQHLGLRTAGITRFVDKQASEDL